MCWAASSRLAAIAAHLGLDESARDWTETASKIQDVLLEQAWSEKRQAFTSAFGTEDLDASVLLLPDIGLIEPTDPRFTQTVAAVEKDLLNDKHVKRYAANDDFGLPEVAFLTCRYWLIDAWWSLGRREEARELFVDSLRHRNSYGLLAEDIHPVTGELWGNFPQTYSMAGLVLTAMRLSRSWEDRYWRG
jgi:GH15 family glucan-1,4-alpha-glucosidase